MSGPGARVQRLVNKADFECLLGQRYLSRSAHFAVHHVSGPPRDPKQRSTCPEPGKLSTGQEPVGARPVDNLYGGRWLGCVVPKRHAKRAVTRNLLKRQVREAFERHAPTLPAGLWLVRLRAPFDRTVFVSARSEHLSSAARAELDALLARMKP